MPSKERSSWLFGVSVSSLLDAEHPDRSQCVNALLIACSFCSFNALHGLRSQGFPAVVQMVLSHGQRCGGKREPWGAR